MADALAQSGSLHDAAPVILRAVCEAFDCEVGLLWMVDRTAEELRFVEIWHRPTAKIGPFEAASRGRSFPRGVGLPGRVFATGKPAWIVDVIEDPNFPRAMRAAASDTPRKKLPRRPRRPPGCRGRARP